MAIHGINYAVSQQRIHEFSTLVEVLRSRALCQPQRLAYTFLSDDETQEASLTYEELDRKSQLIASELHDLNASGERALLLIPPGLDYIAALMGCLYAGVVAVPVYPPRPNRSFDRLQHIAGDASATVALTTTPVLSRIKTSFEDHPELRKLHWIDGAIVAGVPDESWMATPVQPDTLALLQYTSGSTGSPKGVRITHENLLHNSRLLSLAFQYNEDSYCVSWLPMYHDMGLIGSIIQPMAGGYPCTLMAPNTFLRRPYRWLQAISRHRATISGGPNFAYDLCVQRINDANKAELDLSSWVSAFIGAEPVRAETIERFSSAFAANGFRRDAFYPCYGLAEATLIVSGRDKGTPLITHKVHEAEKGTRELVSCGSALGDEQIVIVHPETLRSCRPGEVGEICVSSSSVSQGYWNDAERAHLFDIGERIFLRTGDLGFLDADQLFVTGRLKDLIIIRGVNYYPQDIEQAVEHCHSALRLNSNAAFSIDVAGEERLVVVQEVNERGLSGSAELIETIRQVIAEEFELEAYKIVLIKARTIPKTSSGKIQRRQCRTDYLEQRLEIVAESRFDSGPNQLERTLSESVDSAANVQTWLTAYVANRIGVDRSVIDAGESVMSYGFDSLSATNLMHIIETETGVVLPPTTFLQELSIAELAAQIHSHLTNQVTPVGIVSANESASESPLSRGQQALWFQYCVTPGTAAYNVTSAVRVLNQLDVPALERAFRLLVNRHAVLRTTFMALNAVPVQRVQESVELNLDVIDARNWSEAQFNERLADLAHQPFQLEHGPVFRVHLFRRSEDEHVLQFVVHHIVSDFSSLTLLLEELGEIYQAEVAGQTVQLSPLKLQFSDYVRWQEELLSGPEGERLSNYWLKQLSGPLPVLSLPADHPRPAVQTYQGATLSFPIEKELTARIKALSSKHKTTLYTTLLATFQLLLHRYTGQKIILVGSPTSGRSRAELAGLVGYFVNPVVLKADFSSDMSFESFLVATRECVLQALEHQDYPFASLVETLQPERDRSHSALFQVQFVFQKSSGPASDALNALALPGAEAEFETGGLHLRTVSIDQRFAQFDLSLHVAEVNEQLAAALNYNTDLFDEPTVRSMTEHWRVLLESVVTHPEESVSALPLLTESERRQLLVEWNDTGTTYTGAAAIPQMFQAQVEQTPEAVAVVYEGEQLSYAELNAKANQLAQHLRVLGVGPEVVVGICMERSLEMVVGLLGILKAGGAYLPLDPAYPRERLEFMLEDAEAPVLLTQQALLGQLAYAGTVLSLDSDWPMISRQSSENPAEPVSGEQLAYVIYTSGSTGEPKGVMITHEGIRNRLLWMQEAYQLTTADRILQKTPYSFDVSVWEFFWPLITGARLVLARPGGHQDSGYLVQLIRQEGITIAHFVPSMLQAWLQREGVSECDSLRLVICSGEALSFQLQEEYFSKLTAAELHNLYGPTEASVDVSYWRCQRGLPVVIGRPIANLQLYIVDEHMEPVPVGVAGELVIGGVGLGRGYLQRPELTAEKFVPHPFSCEAGARLYRSGDQARYRRDGEIEYLGRLDEQVKVRGFRIELGEIEASLSCISGVRECVVVARADKGDDQRLIAYLVSNGEAAPNNGMLRTFLKGLLPEYMIPAHFVWLDEIPLTRNGKVDRSALPAAASVRSAETAVIAPRNAVEEVIADAWREVLEIDRVSINDNFFELGGHSILAMKLITLLESVFPPNVPLLTLFFENPTIADFAAAIVESQSGQLDIEQVVSAYRSMDQLSDAELQELLREDEFVAD